MKKSLLILAVCAFTLSTATSYASHTDPIKTEKNDEQQNIHKTTNQKNVFYFLPFIGLESNQ